MIKTTYSAPYMSQPSYSSSDAVNNWALEVALKSSSFTTCGPIFQMK